MDSLPIQGFVFDSTFDGHFAHGVDHAQLLRCCHQEQTTLGRIFRPGHVLHWIFEFKTHLAEGNGQHIDPQYLSP